MPRKSRTSCPRSSRVSTGPRTTRSAEVWPSLCQSKKLYHAAARLFADAFAADPKLADDLKIADRYNAACFASLAGAGQGEDAAKLDDHGAGAAASAGPRLAPRRPDTADQATGERPARRSSRGTTHVAPLANDGDLAGIRDEAALAKLPRPSGRNGRGSGGTSRPCSSGPKDRRPERAAEGTRKRA